MHTLVTLRDGLFVERGPKFLLLPDYPVHYCQEKRNVGLADL